MTLAVSGEIDISNAKAFTEEVHLLFNGGSGQMTLDLQHCVFIDSAGIRALVVLAQEQQARGRTLKLSGVTGEPQRVLNSRVSWIRASWRKEAYPATSSPPT